MERLSNLPVANFHIGNNWKIRIECRYQLPWSSLVAQLVKNPSAMQETLVQFLGWEDPLVEGMATHSNILAWRIPVNRGAWQAAVHGIVKGRTRLGG